MSENGDLCIEVLQLSNDGDDLAPKHLKLVEMVVNGRANEAGIEELEKVLGELKTDEYNEWYFDIYGLTLGQTGYVRFFGEIVEHYTYHSGNYSEDARQAAIKLISEIQIREQEVVSKIHCEGLTLRSGWPAILEVLSKTVMPSRCLETADRLIVRLANYPDWADFYSDNKDKGLTYV